MCLTLVFLVLRTHKYGYINYYDDKIIKNDKKNDIRVLQ